MKLFKDEDLSLLHRSAPIYGELENLEVRVIWSNRSSESMPPRPSYQVTGVFVAKRDRFLAFNNEVSTDRLPLVLSSRNSWEKEFFDGLEGRDIRSESRSQLEKHKRDLLGVIIADRIPDAYLGYSDRVPELGLSPEWYLSANIPSEVMNELVADVLSDKCENTTFCFEIVGGFAVERDMWLPETGAHIVAHEHAYLSMLKWSKIAKKVVVVTSEPEKQNEVYLTQAVFLNHLKENTEQTIQMIKMGIWSFVAISIINILILIFT
jgi:hypothetical protein